MEYLSKSVSETEKIAGDLVKLIDEIKKKEAGATVIGLYGELGSGKTTFMKHLAKSLGVKETVQSPTFIIMKFFILSGNPFFNKLIHIDAYRLKNGAELETLGWREIISDPNSLVCIEWPENVYEIMPKHIVVKFEHIDESSRRINIEI